MGAHAFIKLIFRRYDNNVEALVEHQPVAIDIHFAVLGLLQETMSNSKKAHARITLRMSMRINNRTYEFISIPFSTSSA